MPQPSAYQTQFQQRMRRALGQRTQAGRKVRAYTRLLAGALADAQVAAEAVQQLNADYGLKLPPTTELVEVLTEKVGTDLLNKVTAATDIKGEVVATARVPDSKDGAALPASAAYGERATEQIGKLTADKPKVRTGRKALPPNSIEVT